MLTSAEVKAHLRHRLPDFAPLESPQRLEGGNLNFVWRVAARPRSVVVKQAPPSVALAPDTAFDPARIVFEANGLKLFDFNRELGKLGNNSIRPPACLDIDAERQILIMEDVGEHPHLGVKLLRDGSLRQWGRRLGGFIGKLHLHSAARENLARQFNNAAIQQTRFAVQYQSLGEFFHQAGMSAPDAAIARARNLGERLLKPGRCLIMGDLWPASILIDGTALRLIDWEFIHYGNPAQDIAHLAAHLWMHAECASSRKLSDDIETLCRDFIRQYACTVAPRATELLDAQIRTDCATHFGAEILMRTLGPFTRGYLYDGLAVSDQRVQHAIAVATRSILAGEHPIFAALS